MSEQTTRRIYPESPPPKSMFALARLLYTERERAHENVREHSACACNGAFRCAEQGRLDQWKTVIDGHERNMSLHGIVVAAEMATALPPLAQLFVEALGDFIERPGDAVATRALLVAVRAVHDGRDW